MDHVRIRRLDQAQLDAIVDYVTSTVAARRIVLFGSGATGGMHEHSDLDVAVLVATPDERRAASDALHMNDDAVSSTLDFPVEWVVADEETWARTATQPGSLAHEVLRTGRELYVA